MATVLVIDDDDAVRMLLLRVLEDGGHTAVGAADGRDGVARFARSPTDVVITDIFMPNQEGLGTIIELKRDHPDLPIIAMTGGGSRATLDVLPIAQALGARKTLRKPFTPDEVLAAVAEVLEG